MPNDIWIWSLLGSRIMFKLYLLISGLPNNIRIRIRSSKHYSLTSVCMCMPGKSCFHHIFFFCSSSASSNQMLLLFKSGFLCSSQASLVQVNSLLFKPVFLLYKSGTQCPAPVGRDGLPTCAPAATVGHRMSVIIQDQPVYTLM